MKGKKKELADAEKKYHFLEHMRKHQKSEIVYLDGAKEKSRNVGFVAVFKDKTVWTLPMEATIYTAKMSAIETVLKRIKKMHTIQFCS